MSEPQEFWSDTDIYEMVESGGVGPINFVAYSAYLEMKARAERAEAKLASQIDFSDSVNFDALEAKYAKLEASWHQHFTAMVYNYDLYEKEKAKLAVAVAALEGIRSHTVFWKGKSDPQMERFQVVHDMAKEALQAIGHDEK